jgi:hydroxypyruvate reductase
MSRRDTHSGTEREDLRHTARQFFLDALTESSMAQVFDRHVSCDRGILRVCDQLYDLSRYSTIFVTAIGKASHTMLAALISKLGARPDVNGIACGPLIPEEKIDGFRYFRGGHPTPNADSLQAAESILAALTKLPSDSLAIFLISGGGSSLVEKPITDSISLEDLASTYKVLVHSGVPIAEMNTIRKHLSATKGGRLALAAAPAEQLSIMISDVPDKSLDSLASGPTMPDSTTVDQCYRLVEKYNLLPKFPASVRELFEQRMLKETPESTDYVFSAARWCTVASNASAMKVVVERATSAGFTVEVDNSCDDWDYVSAADYLLKRLGELQKSGSRVCLVSGGEVTVKVEGNSGIGGRNQQFALYCAGKISGQYVTVLSAGTDGIDGNSIAAGALVDGTTVQRAQARDLKIEEALKTFNAFPVFDALGDAIMTGPTGNNVRDLRILLANL